MNNIVIRIEQTNPPRYRTGTGAGHTSNVTVDEGDVVGVYVRTGVEDDEPVYRRVGEERKHG